MCKEKEERGTERESSVIVYIEMQKGDKLRSREYVRSKFWHTGIAMEGGISFPEVGQVSGTVWFLDRYQDRPLRYDKPKL
jgi:hypothetical protein